MRTPRHPTRVFVVEDSAVTRRLLVRLLQAAGDFEVVGSASNGLDAVEQVAAIRPDVVTMDIHLPGIDGIEATRRIVERTGTPILVVSGSSNVTDRTLFDVLEAGALGVVRRPLAPGLPAAAERRDRLLQELRTIAKLSTPVSTARGARARRARPDDPALPATRPPTAARRRIAAIGLAASTGGPAALRRVLVDLPGDAPPVFVVQHMSPGFLGGFAAWLGDVAPGRVSIALDGEPVRPGTILVAPDDRHLGVDAQRRVRLIDSAPVNGHRPSADVLFASLSEAYGAAALGVVLTGMGRDGADGLDMIRRCGGITLAQDRASSVVYGMPAVAAERGAAQQIVPLAQLGVTIGALLGNHREIDRSRSGQRQVT